MAGYIGNYIFAYGFVIKVSNKRYFKGTTLQSDMATVEIEKQWQPFLNEVGCYCFDVFSEEQSKLYVFGERILAYEDGTFEYYWEGYGYDLAYNIQKDVFNAKLKHRRFINREAKINKTVASFLFFMNDKTEGG